MAMANGRRPAAAVQTGVIYNNQDSNGRWIPLRLEIGSWITLKPSSTGPWARDARRHGEETNAGAWKAQIQKFRWHSSTVYDEVVVKLKSILVRHAYQRRQLLLDPAVAALEPRAQNYLYASYWEDWVPPTSVLDVILVIHHEVGEAGRNGRGYRDLLDSGIFYLRALYVPRSGTELYGNLEEIPLPELTDAEWPVPDMHTSEAFRQKLATDITAAMKGSTGSSTAHVQWFLPIHVMADLFACADSIRRTPQMYIFKNVSAKLLRSLMDPGWDEKWQRGQDLIKCVLSVESLVFRYHVGRQVLYATFQYSRQRCADGQTWLPIDQAVTIETVRIAVVFAGTVLPPIDVGRTWPVSHLRNEIAILLPRETIPEWYDLVVERPGSSDVKINARREKVTEIGDVLPANGRFKMVPA